MEHMVIIGRTNRRTFYVETRQCIQRMKLDHFYFHGEEMKRPLKFEYYSNQVGKIVLIKCEAEAGSEVVKEKNRN